MSYIELTKVDYWPMIKEITATPDISKAEIMALLSAQDQAQIQLFKQSKAVKKANVGAVSYLRGLIEFSNVCRKNCLYCGIRKQNKQIARYELTDKQVLEAAKLAHDKQFGSIVIQAGELTSAKFVKRISGLLKEIKTLSNNQLGITLSLGEQPLEVYQEWKQAGAHRYLLRIESSNEALYYKIHPNNKKHDFQTRLQALTDLQTAGYQTGTGVMVGLPFQTLEHLADDLLFFKALSIDMVGMGPYLEHHQTPLYKYRHQLMPIKDRFWLTLRMIAVLRLLMPKINIASATALQAIDPIGRERALDIGANVIMPNITPALNRKNYALYENKPCTDDEAEECVECIIKRIEMIGDRVGLGEWGDSKHFGERTRG